MKYSVGIDIGGMSIAIALIDENYNIKVRSSIETPAGKDGFYFADSIAAEVNSLCKMYGISISDILYAGFGAPGHVDSDTGEIIFACNIGLSDFNLAEELEKRLGCKVYGGNDANAAALGEALAGSAKGTKSSVTITLGTGIGMGIIINDKIFTGCHFCAGEIGHMVIEANGRDCNCGRKGCFETYASATALIKDTKDAMRNNKHSILWDMCGGSLDKVTGKTAFDGMKRGDSTAVKVVKNYIYYLSCGITNIVNLLEPDVICIGGGISAQGDDLIVPLSKLVRKEQYSRIKDTTRIVKAALGNDAGIIGAALLGSQYK